MKASRKIDNTFSKQYPHWKAHASLIFQNYYYNKQLLFTFTQDVIFGRRNVDEGMPKGTSVSNPTERAAIAIASNARMAEAEREVNAVSKVLCSFFGRQTAFVRKVLVDRSLNLKEACDFFCISRRTAVYWKKIACVRLAVALGWMEEETKIR